MNGQEESQISGELTGEQKALLERLAAGKKKKRRAVQGGLNLPAGRAPCVALRDCLENHSLCGCGTGSSEDVPAVNIDQEIS